MESIHLQERSYNILKYLNGIEVELTIQEIAEGMCLSDNSVQGAIYRGLIPYGFVEKRYIKPPFMRKGYYKFIITKLGKDWLCKNGNLYREEERWHN